MKQLLLIFFTILFAFNNHRAQELNCSVIFLTDQIQLTDKKPFDELEEVIYEFMNNRKWTEQEYEIFERIECSFQFTFTDYSPNQFQGNLQVISSRPVYNSDYNTMVLNVLDNDIAFSYQRGARLEFVRGQYTSELSSILAYYAYLIIGMDYDTYSKESGTPVLAEAQDIVLKAQLSGGGGWKASDGTKNRFWIIENHLQPQFKPLRRLLYEYHRQGLDIMYEDNKKGKKQIASSLKQLEIIQRARPLSYNTQIFFQAKSTEIVNMYSSFDATTKQNVYNILRKVDPSRLKDYDKMLKAK